MSRKILFFLTLLAFTAQACMTTYEPRSSPRLVTVMEGGSPVLVKNGKRYSVALFGGELEDAVAPHARAMDHAAAFRMQTMAGFVIGVASSVPIGLGAGMYGNEVAQRHDGTLGLALLTGGIVTYLLGIGLIASAQPHMHDAINTYNDWVDSGMPADATLTE